MNRRELGASLILGAATAGVAGSASAQVAPLGEPEQREVFDTGRVGALSLASSRLAQARARSPGVREFADFETAEQTIIAEVLGEASGLPPPPLTPDQQAQLDALRYAPAHDFERRYVALQVDGHRQLLAIQDRYLATGGLLPMRHVAMLARGQIREHLRLLDDIRRRGG